MAEEALVIGGRGFIGSAVGRLLQERGQAVSCYDLLDGQDVLDAGQLSEAVADADVVFDCAGRLGSAETFDAVEDAINVNVFGSLNVLEACHKHGIPAIYMSLKNEWHNPYMISKRAGTELYQMYHEYLGAKTAVVRGLNAYGPGQHWGAVRKVVPTFVVQALRGEPLVLYGDGHQIIDLVYVDDLAEIMIRLWEWEAWGQVLDGGTGVPLRVVDLAKAIIQLTGSESEIVCKPMRIGEPERAVALADPSQALQVLGYYPQTSLAGGLQRTVDWYWGHWREMER